MIPIDHPSPEGAVLSSWADRMSPLRYSTSPGGNAEARLIQQFALGAGFDPCKPLDEQGTTFLEGWLGLKTPVPPIVLDQIHDLAPHALTLRREGRASAFEAALALSVSALEADSYARTSEHDDSLAAWVAKVPFQALLCADAPGDTPAGGLLAQLFKVGAWPKTLGGLVARGVSLDGHHRGQPLAQSLQDPEHWRVFFTHGQVEQPVQEEGVSLPLWQWLAWKHPTSLRPTIEAWAVDHPQGEARKKALDRLMLGQDLMRTAGQGSRDEALAALREMPDWESYRDLRGRSLLMLMVRQNPSILSPLLGSSRHADLLSTTDADGQNLWSYLLPGLLEATRSALSVAQKLHAIVPFFPDRDHAVGFLLRRLINANRSNQLMGPLASSDRDRQERWSETMKFIGFEGLWAGSEAQQALAASALWRQQAAAAAKAPSGFDGKKTHRWEASWVEPYAACFRPPPVSDALKSAVAMALLSEGGSLLSPKAASMIESWMGQGVLAWPKDVPMSPWRERWSANLAKTQGLGPMRDRALALVDRWSVMTEHKALLEGTAVGSVSGTRGAPRL